MLTIVLALASAAAWGGGDFCGGLAARRVQPLPLALRAHVGGLILLVGFQFVTLRTPVGDAASLGWGAAAGVAGGAGLCVFYGALAVGTMSVVAPVSGVTAAVVPVIAGMAQGERPGALAIVGVVLAFVAIALVGGGQPADAPVAAPDGRSGAGGGGATAASAPVEPSPDVDWAGQVPGPVPVPGAGGVGRSRRRGGRLREALGADVVAAAAAGAGFGLFAVFIANAGTGSGLWPLISGRLATVTGFGLLVVALGQRAKGDGPTRGLIGLAAVGDASANALYLVAVGRGLLAIVGAIVALYPATTVLLARVVLGERLARAQRAGLAVAAVAVALVALA